MKLSRLISLTAFMCVAIFTLAACSSNSEESKASTSSATTATSPLDSQSPSDNSQTSNPGVYADYSQAALAKAQANGNTVLFFHAQWCSTCKGIEKDIKANLQDIPSDLTILQVDFDNSSELKKKYGVRQQYTMVQVDKDGNKVDLWSDSFSLDDIVSSLA